MSMGYWKSKVLPKIKKVFEKNGGKKVAASEACKTFDDSKEEYAKEFEEKKTELQPKVVEIYEASSVEIKALVKEPKDAGLKKYPAAVQKFLDELVKIEFPGSKIVCEASSKFGPTLVPGPIFFVFEKVSTFIVTEEKPAEVEATAPVGEETSSTKEKEIVVEEGEKKESTEEQVVVIAAEAEKITTTTTEPAAATEPAPAPAPAAEPPKP